MLLQALLTFVVGLIVMLASSQVFIKITQRAAAKWKFSPLFISIVLVALGTNIPDLIFTVTAIAKNDPGLAFGNAVGASILILTLTLGLVSLVQPIRVGTKKTQSNTLILLAVTVLFVVLYFSSLPARTQGIVLLLTMLLSLVYQYLAAVNGRTREDKKLLKIINKIQAKKRQFPGWVYLTGFIVSGLGLTLGARIIVNVVGDLSTMLNLSTTFLGLTLTAFVSCTPEIILTLIAAFKDEDKVTIGTLIGSNIFSLTLFAGLILIFAGKVELPVIEMAFLLAATLFYAVTIFSYKGRNIPKKASLVMIGIYLAFIYTSFKVVGGQ